LGFELVKNIYSFLTTKGVVFISIIFAILLFLIYDNFIYDWIGINDELLLTIPDWIKKLITALAVINLLGISYSLSKRLFTTVEAIEAKCPLCKCNMSTKTLKCTNCHKELDNISNTFNIAIVIDDVYKVWKF